MIVTEENDIDPYYHISQSHNHSRKFALPLTPASSRNDISSIHSDLLSCSKVMGISETRLRENASVIRQVAQATKQFLDAVRSAVPEPNHFTAHKNPCFYSNETTGSNLDTILLNYLRSEASQGLQLLKKRFSKETLLKMFTHRRSLVCLPYFYIAGFPKGATTSLHEALQKHPQIASPLGKEPHWWTRVADLSNISSFPQDYAMFHVWTYLSFFKKASEKIEEIRNDGDIVTYDGSQSLLWDSNFFRCGQDYCAMPAILSRVQPNAKFVVVMRNPTTRLYSHFIWSFKYHLGDIEKWPVDIRENISESFHSEAVSVTNRFKGCLRISSLFECASGFKYRTKLASVNRIAHKFYIGLYYVHIRKWLQFFPREQFLFLRMEDIVADFTTVMAQIVDFLGLKQVARGEMEKWLTKANARSGESQAAMKTHTRSLLDEVYGPYNKLLAELLDDDRYLWLDQ